MEDVVSIEDRCREIITDLGGARLSAATQQAIMRELSHKASGFRSGELIAIAGAVTGERCKTGAAALEAIDRFSRQKVALG